MNEVNLGLNDKLTTIVTTPGLTKDFNTHVLQIKDYFFLPSIEIELIKTTLND